MSFRQKETRLSLDKRVMLVETIGIEPMTSCMSSKRSNHLGYASEACILYHIIFDFARGYGYFFKKIYEFFVCETNYKSDDRSFHQPPSLLYCNCVNLFLRVPNCHPENSERPR